MKKKLSYNSLPAEIKQEKDPEKIKKILSKDVTNFYFLSYKDRGNIDYIKTIALEYERKYREEYDLKPFYEERYFFKKIPKKTKRLLNIHHYKTITEINHLYKEILLAISIIEYHKKLNKILAKKPNYFIKRTKL